MPRVHLKKKDYKVNDFCKWLKGKLASEGISQTELAEVINLTQPTISYKIKTGQFDLKEIITIFDFLKATDEEIIKAVKL